MEIIEQLRFPHEFKIVCDAILLHEVGPRVRLFAAKGKDGGTDADVTGEYLGRRGLTVFQFKFVDLATDPQEARKRIRGYFKDPDSEFRKVLSREPVSYVLLTTAPTNPALVDELTKECATIIQGCQLFVWDPTTLNAMLQGREFLARNLLQYREEAAIDQVARPLAGLMQRLAPLRSPLWPVTYSRVEHLRMNGSFADSFSRDYRIDLTLDLSVAELDACVAHPLYTYCSKIAFRRAFARIEDLLSGVAALRDQVAGQVQSLVGRYHAEAGPFSFMDPQDRWNFAVRAAYQVCHVAGGGTELFAMRQGNAISLAGDVIYDGPRVEEVLRLLDGDIDGERAAIGATQMARQSVRDMAKVCSTKLWFVTDLAIDELPTDPEAEPSGESES